VLATEKGWTNSSKIGTLPATNLEKQKHMSIITSVTNPKIRDIRKLRVRKEREQQAVAFIEGIRIVADAANHPGIIETLIVAPELLSSTFARELVQQQSQAGISCLEVSAEVFQSISQKDGPQGLGAVIRQQWLPLAEVTLSAGEIWVALDAVQDPGNLGSIMRTCDAVGCTGLILLGQTTDPYDPAALRGSMGALFALKLVKSSFSTFHTWKERHRYPLVGTSDAARASYTTVTYPLPCILLMGSERQGLSAEQQASCDLMVSIPMVGQSDSLNLSVATAVVLYEIFRQTHPNYES
jgi:TrmH family RNA methyltransferase